MSKNKKTTVATGYTKGKNKMKTRNLLMLCVMAFVLCTIGCSSTYYIMYSDTAYFEEDGKEHRDVFLKFPGMSSYRYARGLYDELEEKLSSSEAKTKPIVSRIGDIRALSRSGIMYQKLSVPIPLIRYQYYKEVGEEPKNYILERSGSNVTFTKADRATFLEIKNSTGYSVQFTSPRNYLRLDSGESTYWQAIKEGSRINVGEEVRLPQTVTVSYTIRGGGAWDGVRFSEDVVWSTSGQVYNLQIKNIDFRNETGYPITLESPYKVTLANNALSSKYNAQSANESTVNLRYRCGSYSYQQNVPYGDTHSIKERPPLVTIQNNTGATVNLVYIRIPGGNWTGDNVLQLQLNAAGVVDKSAANAGGTAIARHGSITNKDDFTFWLGNLNLGQNPERFDIRIDDVNGKAYVKSNVQITKDTTLNFTKSDER